VWTPEREGRLLRRTRRQAANPRRATKRSEVQDHKRAEEFPAPAYRRAGDSRPEALRSRRRFVVPTHRATTAIVSRAYPFLAEGGLGSEGVYIGLDVHAGGAFVYDPWILYQAGVLTNPNALVAGRCRSIPLSGWSAGTRVVGGMAITLGPARRRTPSHPRAATRSWSVASAGSQLRRPARPPHRRAGGVRQERPDGGNRAPDPA